MDSGRLSSVRALPGAGAASLPWPRARFRSVIHPKRLKAVQMPVQTGRELMPGAVCRIRPGDLTVRTGAGKHHVLHPPQRGHVFGPQLALRAADLIMEFVRDTLGRFQAVGVLGGDQIADTVRLVGPLPG